MLPGMPGTAATENGSVAPAGFIGPGPGPETWARVGGFHTRSDTRQVIQQITGSIFVNRFISSDYRADILLLSKHDDTIKLDDACIRQLNHRLTTKYLMRKILRIHLTHIF